MRQYADVEEALTDLFELRAFYDNARCADWVSHAQLGCKVMGGTVTSDHLARAQKAILEEAFAAACGLVPLYKWAVWVDLRVSPDATLRPKSEARAEENGKGNFRMSQPDALRRHNERMVAWGKRYLCKKSSTTMADWAREVHGIVEGELARRRMIK